MPVRAGAPGLVHAKTLRRKGAEPGEEGGAIGRHKGFFLGARHREAPVPGTVKPPFLGARHRETPDEGKW